MRIILNSAILVLMGLATAAWGARHTSGRVNSAVEDDGKARGRSEEEENGVEADAQGAHRGARNVLPPEVRDFPPPGLAVDVLRNPVTNQVTLGLRGALMSRLVSDTEVLGPT